MSRMTDVPPLQLIVGPDGHGVVAYATDVASALRSLDARINVARVERVADAVVIAYRAPRVHLHVTERILGGSPEQAAQNLEWIAAVTRLTVTAHDVPQSSDGTALARRIRAYSRFLTAPDSAAVNSRHEQRLVAEFLPGVASPRAIPLGARRSSTPPGPRSDLHLTDSHGRRELVVLLAGYIYPGKGHAQAIRAAAEAARALTAAGEPVGAVVVRAIGGASAGHEGDVLHLQTDAERHGVRWEMTGFVGEDEFATRIGEEGIPLAAHQHVSASRSMLDWVEAGRRPLVADSRYAREMQLLRPDTIALYDPADLSTRIAEAWREPSRTWLASEISLAPTLVDVAEAYLAWWGAEKPR